MIRAIAVAGAATALTLTSLGAAHAKQLHYANCTAPHKDFRHGVSKSKAAAQKQVRDGYGRPAYGTHARNVYWATTRAWTATRTAPPARHEAPPTCSLARPFPSMYVANR